MARQLVEASTDLIVNYLKANLATALADIRTDRGDAQVSTEPPQNQNYFIFSSASGYQTPAIFVIADNIDFKKQERGPNYISAVIKYYVAALIEDRREKELTIKSWRYQAALHEILDQVRLENVPENVTIVVIVKRARFSGIEARNANQGIDKTFRREVVLECDVEHWESVA